MPLRGVHRCELVYIEVCPHLNELIGISMTRQGDTEASYRFYPLGKYSLSTHNAAAASRALHTHEFALELISLFGFIAWSHRM